MIGHFQTAAAAAETQALIERLREGLVDEIKPGDNSDRLSDPVLELLRRESCYNLGPGELEQFLYDTPTRLDGTKVILTTDESEVSAFFKLMMKNGAKVEIYSAHDYPDTHYGRGK